MLWRCTSRAARNDRTAFHLPSRNQKDTRARVFVAFTPSIDRISDMTMLPIASSDSASTFAIRSYSPNKG